MTNFYNILGLEQDAELPEIKTAYRKLSKKFHPDVNPNDEFFNKMFLQIQEAYEVLSNPELRKKYDGILYNSYRKSFSPGPASSTKRPLVANFSVDKLEVGPNEEFTITWETKNADFIQIRPLGIFPPEGFDRFSFNKLKGRGVNLVIIATDTETGLSARQHLFILNKKWRPSFFEDDKKTQITIIVIRVIFVLLILAFILAIMIFGVQKVDPLDAYK
ncbi:MAG: J domain-containing protein [Flavobacteriaceae bacterium]|nr:J domain-containing protein [Flavobacteriaceae bacterium]